MPMRDYSARPRPRSPRPRGAPPPARPTWSVRVAATLAWSVSLLLVLDAALTLHYLDRIGVLAGVGSSFAQQQAARNEAVFTALFTLAVFGSAWALFGWLLRRGQHTARVALTVLAALSLLVGFPGVLRDQPLPLLLSALAQLALQVAILGCLWRPDANDYLQPRH